MHETRLAAGGWIAMVGVCHFALACETNRDRASPPARTYEEDVAPIFATRCTPCHAGKSPASGWDATSYVSAIACIEPSGAPAALPNDARAPLLTVLDTATHRDRVDSAERTVIAQWVAAGTPASVGAVHAPGIVDPRSDTFHGKLLRARRWAPMLDPRDPEVCGRCHDGAPARPSGVSLPAPGATACTTCHTESQGVLACSTCHGSGQRAYPPRDPCFFPAERPAAGAHAAHVERSAARAAGLACGTCHRTPEPRVVEGTHGNGSVEVIFDPTLIAGDASYDRGTRICAVACHDRGGGRSRPAWSETGPARCDSCHGSPPARHFPGPCTSCHREANATGTALSGGPLHLNGRVDLGDGSGKCGACHGESDDPWPRTAAHRAHASPTLTMAIGCSNCHVVPSSILERGHLDGTVRIAFSSLATARGASPTWDGATCNGVACHGARLVDPPSRVPTWRDPSGAASACGACHGVPPTQHTPSSSCERATCHGPEVARDAQGMPRITPAGKALHANGQVDHEP